MVRMGIVFLCASSMAVMLGFGIVGPILPQYILTFDATYMVAGLVISAFPLARMCFNFPAGILADRIGRRRPLSIGIATSRSPLSFVDSPRASMSSSSSDSYMGLAHPCL